MIDFYQGDGKGRKKGSKEVTVSLLDDSDSQLSHFCNIYRGQRQLVCSYILTKCSN